MEGLDDTWLWDGADWTQAADTGPSARAASAMVAAATMVLFGGVSSIAPALRPASRIIYGDSWRWDGRAWTKVQDIGPARGWGHGMAFRSDASRIMLFGGSSVFGPAQDESLQAGIMRDTWEHAEAAAEPSVTIQSFIIRPAIVAGAFGRGGTTTGVITLRGPAPAGGATVQLTKEVSPPQGVRAIFLPVSQVTIPANSNSALVSIQCRPQIQFLISANVTAKLGAST